jgi:hypothetical protein
MRWLAYTLQILLALLFLFSAYGKITAGVEEIRIHLGIAPWLWATIAMIEVVGALALVGGLRLPRLAVFGGLWLGITMAVAVLTHLSIGDPLIDAASPAILTALTLAVAGLRWPAARIGSQSTKSTDERRPPAPAAA